jgi:hypothetical protein
MRSRSLHAGWAPELLPVEVDGLPHAQVGRELGADDISL